MSQVAGEDGRAERCAWCGAALSHGATRLRGRVLCGKCGVASTDPWPSESELNDAYGSWYRPESGRFSGVGDKLFRLLRGGFARRLNQIAPPGPILDVGAGDGSLVDGLRKKGREATGLDPYSTRDDFLKTSIESVEGQWAAVVFWHSLEHLPTPTHDLEAASQLLQPGGLLIVAVPNASSLQAKVFGSRWLHLDLPRHLVHITSNELVRTVSRLGMHVERVSFYRGGNVLFGWLHGLVGSLSTRFDLYDAIRRPEARSRPMSTGTRLMTVVAGCLLFPVAAAASVIEIALRRGGTVYLEGRARS